MDLKITGLDKVQRELEDAKRALKSLGSKMKGTKFDVDKPENVQKAIREMEKAVDRAVSPYGGNAIVSQLAQATKDELRDQILKHRKV